MKIFKLFTVELRNILSTHYFNISTGNLMCAIFFFFFFLNHIDDDDL